MTTTHTVSVPKVDIDAEALGYFRFGRFADGWILTNEYGEWHHLADTDFQTFLTGGIDAEHAEHDALAAKGFLREQLDLDALADAMRRRKRFVGLGPSQHLIRLADAHGALTVEVAKDIIDHAMLSTSGALTLRLIEGSSPADRDLLQFVAQYTTEKNRYEGKALTYELVTDMAALDEELAKWLVDKRFSARTTTNGHGALSEAQAAGIALLADAARAKRRDATPVTLEVHLGADHASAEDLVAALVASGAPTCRLVPVLHGEGAITPAALAAFYPAFLDALLAARNDGAALREELTAGVVSKAMRTDAVDDPTLRSPAGGGTAAYDTQGHLFPSLAGAALHDAGDEMFLIGTVGITSYKDAVSHPTRRALTLASMLESQPGFADHWATPFFGLDPVNSFVAAGDLFPKMNTDAHARAMHAVTEALFAKLVTADDEALSHLRGLFA